MQKLKNSKLLLKSLVFRGHEDRRIFVPLRRLGHLAGAVCLGRPVRVEIGEAELWRHLGELGVLAGLGGFVGLQVVVRVLVLLDGVVADLPLPADRVQTELERSK